MGDGQEKTFRIYKEGRGSLTMRKIKNFKINLRTRDIVRSVKRLAPGTEFSQELDIEVQKACRHYYKFIRPCLIYDTFSKGTLEFLPEKDAPAQYIARSVFFVSIGAAIEDVKKDLDAPNGENIVNCIAVDALDQSKNFVCRLISDEAEEEECDISRAQEIHGEFYERLSSIIPIDKIDISLCENTLIPKYCLCAEVYWTPSKKKRKR
jgi:hypothetical protein